MSKTVVFFGNEKLATGVETDAPIFNGLIEANYHIKALIIARKLDKRAEDLAVVKSARKHNIDVRSFDKLKQSIEEIANLEADTAVLAAYGKIVPKEVIDIFNIGIINIHPSLLPKHRGPTPIESAILDGDKETGVSIMKLAVNMDAGPVYKQGSLPLKGNETKQELVDKLSKLGKDLLIGSLDDIISGKLLPEDQPIEGSSYDKLIDKVDGLVNWEESWLQIDRKIRAYSGWPRTRFNLSGKEIALISAHFEKQTGSPGQPTEYDDTLAIYCSDGLVVIDSLIPAGGKQMSGSDYLRGYRDQLLKQA